MNKIVIYYGSNRAFSEVIPIEHRNLTDVVMEIDNDSKNMILHIPDLAKNENDKETKPKEEKEKIKIQNFVINSDEYSGVREHVIINFANFISKLEIENMYVQNPPLHISEQLHRLYDVTGNIEVVRQSYSKVDKNVILKFNAEYDDKIIGQENVKTNILQALYPLVNDRQTKPVILLFYGDSGIGKTETANYLAKLLHGTLMRKQFSMYQNNDFATYLFGGTNNEGSFAKDLLDRDSNVILLDEFDKANPIFHSAFYQLFDEGVFEDKNYKVRLDYSIVICTSNYKTKEEIIEHLGNAIFNRFDAVIHFDNLSITAKEKIADRVIKEATDLYEQDGVVIEESIKQRLKDAAASCSNVREIKRIIKQTFSLVAIRKICEETKDI